MKTIINSLTLVSLSVISSWVNAENIRVLNQNFESDAINPSNGFNSYISGWVNSGYGSIGVKAPTEAADYTDVAAHGQVAFLNEGARLTQTVDADLQNNETYTLTFDAGRPSTELGGQSYIVRFKAYGLALAQLQVDGSAVAPGTWQQKSLSFTSNANMPIGKPLVVEFQNLASTTGNQVHLDNVKISKAGTGDPLPVEPIGDNGLEMVPVNLTLKVPENYTTINDALDYLDNLHIKVGKIVTIKVSDCTNQTFAHPIMIDHPHGESIHIVGDTNAPANCVLSFTGASGFLVDNNHAIGLIDGFQINGTDAAGTRGIWARNGGNITLGSNLWVSNFEQGIYAEKNGQVFADYVASFGNTADGIFASYNGLVRATGASSYDNGGNGYNANHSGFIYVNSSSAQNNGGSGYYSQNQSYIQANNSSSTISANEGYYSINASAIIAKNSNATGFTTNGFRAYYQSFFDRTGNNTTSASPAIGSTGNSMSNMK